MTSPVNPHRERQRALITAQLERAKDRRARALSDLEFKQEILASAEAAVEAAGADVAAMQALLNRLD